MKFKVKYCSQCETEYIECPKCGNNTCNGTYGEINEVECDVCELAYQYDELRIQLKYGKENVEKIREKLENNFI